MSAKRKSRLDGHDTNIMYQLEKNCRLPNSQIGRIVGLSKAVVGYRISRMEKEGIITGYYPFINTGKMGLIYARIFLKYSNISPEKEDTFIADMVANDEISLVVSQEGYWDLVLVAICKDIKSLNDLYKKILYTHPNCFKDKELSIATKLYAYTHRFLWQEKDDTCCVIDSDTPVIIDETDSSVIKSLSKNARIGVLELAKDVGISPKTVLARIRALVKLGVIQGFRPSIDIEKLHMNWFHVFVKLRNTSQKAEASLVTYLQMHQSVIYITRAIGRYDLEFEMVLPNHNDLYREEKLIKQKFPENIDDFESALIYKIHKQSTL